jgi:hypothetical protein
MLLLKFLNLNEIHFKAVPFGSNTTLKAVLPPRKHCRSSVRFFNVSLTALSMLPIVSKLCLCKRFLILGKRPSQMGTDLGNTGAGKPQKYSWMSEIPSQKTHCNRLFGTVLAQTFRIPKYVPTSFAQSLSKESMYQVYLILAVK